SSKMVVPPGFLSLSGTAVLSTVTTVPDASLNETVSGGIEAGVAPSASSTMVIEEVPEGTSKGTTSPTLCDPRSISCKPALGTTGFVHAGLVTGQGEY